MAVAEFMSSKALELLLGLGKEAGGEVIGELAADWFLGRRGQNDGARNKFVELFKSGDKEALEAHINTNAFGIGQGDEEILKEDLLAILAGELVTGPEAKILDEFLFSDLRPGQAVKPFCLNEKLRKKFRQGHVLQMDKHLRRRDLARLAKLSSHRERFQKAGAWGLHDTNFYEKTYAYATESNPQIAANTASLKRKAAQEKAKFYGHPSATTTAGGLFQRLLRKIGI